MIGEETLCRFSDVCTLHGSPSRSDLCFLFILTLFHLCCLALAISNWTLGDLRSWAVIKLGRGTACHAFVQSLVAQALEQDCKWPTYLVGEVSIFWMWAIPGHPIHSHQDHMVLLTPCTETTGVFWCICWVTFLYSHGTVPENYLSLWHRYNWASKEGRAVLIKKKSGEKTVLCSGQRSGWEWWRDQVSACQLWKELITYSPCISLGFLFGCFFVLKEW